MAIIMANRDGTSNAKPGDVVVTGGGLFRKNEDGPSTKIGSLNTPTGTSKNYDDVLKTYTTLTSGSGAYKPAPAPTPVPVIKETPISGVVELEPDPLFDPNEYVIGGNSTYGTSNSSPSTTYSSGLNNILGYVIVGLVGIALLDRFMNSGKK